MKSVRGEGIRNAVQALDGLLFALCSAAAYRLALWVNEWISPWDPMFFGVYLVFLPAGVKLLAILVGHHWGALGILVVEFLVRWAEYGGLPGTLVLLELTVWVGSTYLAVLWLLRSGRLPWTLAGVTLRQLAIIAIGTAATNALANNAFALATGRLASESFWHSAMAWMVGDVVGALIVLGLLHQIMRRFSADRIR